MVVGGVKAYLALTRNCYKYKPRILSCFERLISRSGTENGPIPGIPGSSVESLTMGESLIEPCLYGGRFEIKPRSFFL
jgi:hypothetical protein